MNLLLIAGLIIALSAAWFIFGYWLRGYFDNFPVPPGTRRQLKRAARANRADLSTVRHPLPELLVPRALDDFDHGDTHK